MAGDGYLHETRLVHERIPMNDDSSDLRSLQAQLLARDLHGNVYALRSLDQATRCQVYRKRRPPCVQHRLSSKTALTQPDFKGRCLVRYTTNTEIMSL